MGKVVRYNKDFSVLSYGYYLYATCNKVILRLLDFLGRFIMRLNRRMYYNVQQKEKMFNRWLKEMTLRQINNIDRYPGIRYYERKVLSPPRGLKTTVKRGKIVRAIRKLRARGRVQMSF